jgi:hypothetical protein
MITQVIFAKVHCLSFWLLLGAMVGWGACSNDLENLSSQASDVAVQPETTDDTSGSATDVNGENDHDSGKSLAMELGLTQYTGKISPQVHSESARVTTYRFDKDEGPVCMRGGEFFTAVRDVGSEDLAFFFQDGGVCWSRFCLAMTIARPGIPTIDILNPDLDVNPVKDWNHVFVPYCDGSFFAGDVDYSDDLNKKGTRYHRGLANMTAAFEVAKIRFPNPDRVLLSGSSGGAYGLLFSGILARHYYPDAELVVMADSGIGIAKSDEPDYLQGILDEFDLNRFIPKDCEDCIDNGHLTGLLSYFLERDTKVRMGMYSSWRDTILAKLYLQIPAHQFASSLEEQTDRLHAAYPDRFRRFITAGIQHTTLPGKSTAITGTDWDSLEMPPGFWQTLMTTTVQVGKMKTTKIQDLSVAEWMAAMIEGDLDVWMDIQEELETP